MKRRPTTGQTERCRRTCWLRTVDTAGPDFRRQQQTTGVARPSPETKCRRARRRFAYKPEYSPPGTRPLMVASYCVQLVQVVQ